MGYTIIAPVGDNLKALFVGMKEFPTERVILLTQNDKMKEAQELSIKLEEFTIPSQIQAIRPDPCVKTATRTAPQSGPTPCVLGIQASRPRKPSPVSPRRRPPAGPRSAGSGCPCRI